MVVERALRKPDVDDHALVGVVVAVEDQALQRRRRVAPGGRDALDDRLEDLRDAGSLFRGREEHLLAGDREDVLEFLHHDIRLSGGKVDLVEDRDDRQSLAQGEVDVGEGLRLDALGRVDHEDRALARLEGVADLVGEVHVPGRVDEVQAIGQAVAGRARAGPPAP